MHESTAGILLFQVNDESFKLVAKLLFKENKDAIDALRQVKSHELGDKICKFLKKNISEGGPLVVNDKQLAKFLVERGIKAKEDLVLQKRLKIEVEAELLKHLGLTEEEMRSRWRYVADSLATGSIHAQVKEFDVMIIQNIRLYDDLEKEINMHCMRIKEWYGLHFPELAELVESNEKYLRVVSLVGKRENLRGMAAAEENGFFDLCAVKTLAERSVGSDLKTDDILRIREDADTVLGVIDNRRAILAYLKEKMHELAPNVTGLLGTLVGARLVFRAGSFAALGKMPASTIQILGAEKALFNALRQNGKTPKFGILFHAPLVANSANKGKMARMLAAKVAIAARVDYFRKDCDGSVGKKFYEGLEKRRVQMQEKGSKGVVVKRKSGVKRRAEDTGNKKQKK